MNFDAATAHKEVQKTRNAGRTYFRSIAVSKGGDPYAISDAKHHVKKFHKELKERHQSNLAKYEGNKLKAYDNTLKQSFYAYATVATENKLLTKKYENLLAQNHQLMAEIRKHGEEKAKAKGKQKSSTFIIHLFFFVFACFCLFYYDFACFCLFYYVFACFIMILFAFSHRNEEN